jgi:hypothetical protein
MTLGLIQLFNYFDMDMKTRVISAEAKKTVETEKSYPLTIEEVRLMYARAIPLEPPENLRAQNIYFWVKLFALRERKIIEGAAITQGANLPSRYTSDCWNNGRLRSAFRTSC